MTEYYHFEDGTLTIEDPSLSLNVHKAYDLPSLPQQAEEDPHLVIEKDATGNVASMGREDQGSLHGEFCLYFSNGTVQHRCFYDHGKLVGPSTYYSESGSVMSETWYVDGLKQGKNRQFYASGSLYAIQKYLDGKLHGKQQYYYLNGDPKAEMNYQRGELDGEVTLYYPRKVVKRSINYEKGARKGWEYEYDERGEKRFEVLHPEQEVVRSWYPSGKMAEEKVLIKEVHLAKEGPQPKLYHTRRWREDGMLFYDESFDAEKQVVRTLRFDPEGGKAQMSQKKWDGQAFIAMHPKLSSNPSS